MPEGFLRVNKPSSADVLITNKQFKIQNSKFKNKIYLRPKNLIIGIGCNSRTSENEIEDAVKRVLAEKNYLSFQFIVSQQLTSRQMRKALMNLSGDIDFL